MIIEYHFASENLKLYKKLIQNLKNNFFKIKIEKISDDIGMIYAVNTKNNK